MSESAQCKAAREVRWSDPAGQNPWLSLPEVMTYLDFGSAE